MHPGLPALGDDPVMGDGAGDCCRQLSADRVSQEPTARSTGWFRKGVQASLLPQQLTQIGSLAGGSMKKRQCDRCGRRWRGQSGWNATMKAGWEVGTLCPGCQTPEENAEAEINLATRWYSRDATDRVTFRPKGL